MCKDQRTRINRRLFLKSTGMALVACGGFLPDAFVRMASASSTRNGKVLVTIFLRGAVDGLSVVVPYAEKTYNTARPSIAIPRPGKGGGALDLDGFFGFHPALDPIHPLYANRSIAVVHAAGSPHPSRSHFDAQDFMEAGTPGVKTTRDGFLSRALGEPGMNDSQLRAVSLTPTIPRILSGRSNALAMRDITQFGVRAGRSTDTVSESFEAMYANAVDESLSSSASDSFEAIRAMKAADPSRIRPDNGAQYPRGELGDSLRQIAQLIRSGVGLEVAFAEAGGWDTHANQGSSDGLLARLLGSYARAVSAFVTDLGSKMSNVVIVTMSEFGRTVRENGNRGTDHGHGNVMFVLGGGVKGGKVYGTWPGLDERHLFEGRDLEVTTDFRDVMGEVLAKHAGVTRLETVFPGHANARSNWVGLI